jgi:endoglucanase
MKRWISWLTTLFLVAPGTATVARAQTGTGLAEVLLKGGVQTLHRDGNPWTPHGVVQIAFVAPPVAQVSGKPFGPAYNNQRNADYADMKAHYGIDSVRIQVSQPAWDPNNTAIYNAAGSAEFRSRFLGAVSAARAAGLTVIISMQDESQT